MREPATSLQHARKPRFTGESFPTAVIDRGQEHAAGFIAEHPSDLRGEFRAALDPDGHELADAQRFRNTEPEPAARYIEEDNLVLDTAGIDENCGTPKIDSRGAFSRPRNVFDSGSPAIRLLP